MKMPVLIPLSKAPANVEKMTGERCHAATIFRWHSRGLKGVRLRAVHANGKLRTTETWLMDFFEAVGAAATSGEGEIAPTSANRSSILEAERALEAAGM